MTLESIEKLRKAAVANKSSGGWERDTIEFYADELIPMLDEIEREVAERMAELGIGTESRES